MRYTLDRFKARSRPADPPEDGEVTDAVTNAAELSTWSGRLDRVLQKLDKRRRVGTAAKGAITALMERAHSVDTQEDVDTVGKLLSRVLKFVGKRVVKAIVRPVLQFASRVAMNALRIASRVALRFIVMPVINLVGAGLMAALASPVGWVVLGGAAILGGGYMLWKRRAPEVIEVEDTPSTGAVVDSAAPEVSSQGSAAEATPSTELPRTRFDKLLDTVRQSSPVQAIESAVERPKVYVAKKGSKFQGFGGEVDGYIREAATRYPILSEDVLRGFIKMEAGWTGNMSPTGAIGTGQFTAGTWNRLISRGGAAIGMTPITGIYGEEKDASGRTLRPSIKPNPKGNFRTEQDPRFNKRVNTLATGLLAAGNAEMLKRAGLPITGANLYMMHNIGPGIIAVMKGEKASPATLKAMRQNGMVGQINTASKFLEYQKGRFEVAYQQANSGTMVAADSPSMRAGITVEAAKKKASAAELNTAKTAPVSGNHKGDLVKGPNGAIVRM